MKAWVLSVVCLSALTTSAQETPAGQGWSVLSGKRGDGSHTTLEAGVGWPGLHLEVLHSAGSKVSFGGRLTFNWGFEGNVQRVAPGLKLQGVAKVAVWRQDRLDFGLHFSPGMLFYFPARNVTWLGLTVPFGASLGITPSDAVHVAVQLELPLFFLFGNTAYGNWGFPVMAGVGVEYFLSSNLALFFKLNMGPSLYAFGTEFALEGKLGVGWRL